MAEAPGPMELAWRSAHVSGTNASWVEALYEQYLQDPNQVPDEWRSYFDTLPLVEGNPASDLPHSTVREHFLLLAKNRQGSAKVQAMGAASDHQRKQFAVGELISAYRRGGHRKAHVNPLNLAPPGEVASLTLEYHGLSAADLDTGFETGTLFFGEDQARLADIVEVLERTYCGSLGIEYFHITDEAEQMWMQQRVESVRSTPVYGDQVQRMTLGLLIAAEGLERYLGTRYPGTKRFGLEGAESFIPLISEVVHRAGGAGVVETVIGMAHRGRLNLLVNLMGKSPADLFDEFEGRYKPGFGSGDVKYHQGFSTNIMSPGGEMHLALMFNPSHLEIVGPVVEGSVRARQDRRRDPRGDKVLPISVHGDAAFAGQGVVMETFQMSQTRGFHTGGTIHIIINNQIGFTTSRKEDARSTDYCTEVAKMVKAPILHVNADDPNAVVFAARVALDYRMEFHKDVVIDLVCYRRRGHNEGDDPLITQPVMYQTIKEHPTTLARYSDSLIQAGVLTHEEYEAEVEAYRKHLDEGGSVTLDHIKEPDTSLFVDWKPYLGHSWKTEADTSFDLPTLQALCKKMLEMPKGFLLHRQVDKLMEDRNRMSAGALPVNWGFAEIMAYASLLHQGTGVRLTGQDVGRGTFSHRHAVLYDQKEGGGYCPLAHLYEGQPDFEIYDSYLSEEAVLAFEYGYAATSPHILVLWEAQFGDFANGAQVVIDQFITSGENKWGRLCGLTMLLPHGYEGAGAEHSSARLERYLQLSAEHNIQVCVPSTPAQMFHLLRRQAIRPLRRPLIIMTPKSLLRHKLAISTLEDLSHGSFQPVLPDPGPVNPERVTRLVLCSGKVFYDLYEQRQTEELEEVAILRQEQLYPFPVEELYEASSIYPNLRSVTWCQEEPMNQGAWYSSQHHMRRAFQRLNPDLYLQYSGREASAAAAAGYASLHVKQQEELVRQALHA